MRGRSASAKMAVGTRKLRRTVVPLPIDALDLDFGAMPLHHAIHHGQSEAGAAFAFRSKERLQAAAAGFLVHADPGIHDFDMHILGATHRTAVFR